jgi:VCBS repeat-containing protein
VTNVNEAPSITSGSSASVAENTTSVMTVTGTDPDAGTTLTYSITGGADASKFTIDSSTGALSFAAAPDYENPTDSNADNVYDVTVQVSDGSLTASQAVAVTVTNVNEAPSITSGSSASVAENTTAVMTVTGTDPDAGTTLTYSIAGGADASKFTIDSSTGALSFAAAPNYENPTDSNADNVYNVTVQVSDGSLTASQAVAVTVTNVNEAPTITSPGTVSATENGTVVMKITAVDPDAGTSLIYSIVGGADAAQFTIDSSTGVLSFITPPSFANPTDVGANNVYDVVVQASDGTLADAKSISVSVESVGTPVISQPIAQPPEEATPVPPASQNPAPAAKIPAAAKPVAQHPPQAQLPAVESVPQTQVAAMVYRQAPETPYHHIRSDATQSYVHTINFLNDFSPPPHSRVPLLQQVQINRGQGDSSDLGGATTKAVVISGLAVSTTAAFWIGRGSALFSSLVVSAPTWLRYDFLPVLQQRTREDVAERHKPTPAGADAAPTRPKKRLRKRK